MYASARSLLPCRQRLGQGFTGIHLDEERPMRGSGISESFERIVGHSENGPDGGTDPVVCHSCREIPFAMGIGAVGPERQARPEANGSRSFTARLRSCLHPMYRSVV